MGPWAEGYTSLSLRFSSGSITVWPMLSCLLWSGLRSVEPRLVLVVTFAPWILIWMIRYMSQKADSIFMLLSYLSWSFRLFLWSCFLDKPLSFLTASFFLRSLVPATEARPLIDFICMMWRRMKLGLHTFVSLPPIYLLLNIWHFLLFLCNVW